MMSRARLRWLAAVVLPVAIVLLLARLGGPTDAAGLSPAGQLAALVTCVLSGDSVQAPSVPPPAQATEADQFDCDSTWADPLRTAWISAC